jgi:hypothetical protein
MNSLIVNALITRWLRYTQQSGNRQQPTALWKNEPFGIISILVKKPKPMEPFKITIAEPCRENWNNMLPIEQGRFCAVCDKSVVDFTQKSPAQIQSVLQHANGKVCGRFNTTDLDRVLVPETLLTPTRKLNTKWFAWLTIFAFLGFSKKAGAIQEKISEKQKPGRNRINVKQGHTILHGTIRHSETKQGVADVIIKVYSGGKEIAYTKSISTGTYWLNLPENSIADFNVDIEYNAVNFEGKLLENLPVTKEMMKLDVLLMQKLDCQSLTLGSVSMRNEARIMSDLQAVNYETNIVHSTLGGPMYQTAHMDELTATYINPEEKIIDSAFIRDEVIVPKEIAVKTYPNPTTGFITIDVENAEQISIQLFDMGGKMMHSSTSRETKNSVDMTNFPNGIYIVRVVNDANNKVVQSRVVKTN